MQGRYNKAELGKPGTYEKEGIYVGLVGSRFHKLDKMEGQHITVSEKFSRPEFGFGVEGARLNPMVASQLRPFAALYPQPYFPSYEEARADATGKYYPLNLGFFFNIAAYKALIRIPIECILIDTDAPAQKAGTMDYVSLVRLGLGVWMKCDKQPQWSVDVVADVLQSLVIPHVADVDFN